MSDRADIRELHSQEAIPDAVFNMQQGSTARKRAAEAIRRQQITDNPRAITESLNPTPLTLESMQYAIQRNISADKSTGTLDRSPEQQDRVNRANAAAELAHTILEKGYANMTEGQKRQVRERVLPEMQRLWPALNTAFGTMTRTERQKAMDDILLDPQFSQQLRIIIEELQIREVTDGSEAKSAYEQAKEAYEKKDLEKKDVERQHTAATDQKNAFTATGEKGRELSTLDSISALESQLEAKKSEIASLESEQTRIVRQINNETNTLGKLRTGAPEVTDVNNRLTALNNHLANIENEIRTKKIEEQGIQRSKERREALEKEKSEAGSTERDKLVALETIEDELKKLKEKMLIAQADKDLAALGRGANEEAFVKEFQRSFANAAEKVVRERIQQMEQAKDTVAKGTPTAALSQGLERRWVNIDGKLDKKTIKRDYERLVHDQLDEVVKDALQAQGGMRSRADVEHQLATDREFAKTAREQTAEKILARYLQTGGKLTPDEARKLADSELGLELASQAFERNAELKKKLDELQEKQHVPRNWNWKTTLIKLPKVTRRQLVTAGLVGAGVFFGAPLVMPLLDKAFDWGIENWKTTDFPEAMNSAREHIATAADTVREELRDIRN